MQQAQFLSVFSPLPSTNLRLVYRLILTFCYFCSLDPDAQNKPDPEQELLNTIESKQFEKIKTKLTAKALMVLPNPLLSAIRVSGNVVFIARIILIQWN